MFTERFHSAAYFLQAAAVCLVCNGKKTFFRKATRPPLILRRSHSGKEAPYERRKSIVPQYPYMPFPVPANSSPASGLYSLRRLHLCLQLGRKPEVVRLKKGTGRIRQTDRMSGRQEAETSPGRLPLRANCSLTSETHPDGFPSMWTPP